jgi:hypothetical protein
VRTRCLSIHSRYRCRHSGACCQAEWDIDVEPRIVEAVATGRVIPVSSTQAAFVPGVEEPWTVTLARTSDGWCGFRQEQRCSLQNAGGEEMLPSACRHFPRVFLRDGRGTMVTLSHYCPTAAALLLQDGPVTVVDALPPLALAEPIDGLDAREALPPLVRPGLLADMEGYAAWEEAALAQFAAAPSADVALAGVAAATERVRQWTPSRGRLIETVISAFAAASSLNDGGETSLSEGFGAVREVTGPHPLLQVDTDFSRTWTTLQAQSGDVLRGPIANYMAACTFANWTAYRGQGLRTVVAWLHGCYDVLRIQLVQHARAAGTLNRDVMIESFRMADFIIVHTVPSLEFGRTAAVFEHVVPRYR